MKLKIKVKAITPSCMPGIIKVGDWIDLSTAEEYTFKCPHAKMLHKRKKSSDTPVERSRDVVFDYQLLSLGVVIEMPKGYEAMALPRSSTFKKWGILLANGEGVIDQQYCGPDDIWRFPALATRNATIPKGTPIAQFRIQLSQKATFWQKVKWLFTSGIELVEVQEMDNDNRGGIGTGSDKYKDDKCKTNK